MILFTLKGNMNTDTSSKMCAALSLKSDWTSAEQKDAATSQKVECEISFL